MSEETERVYSIATAGSAMRSQTGSAFTSCGVRCKTCRGHGFVWIREVHVMCLDCKGRGATDGKR